MIPGMAPEDMGSTEAIKRKVKSMCYEMLVDILREAEHTESTSKYIASMSPSQSPETQFPAQL
jgi:hypothetical protein